MRMIAIRRTQAVALMVCLVLGALLLAGCASERKTARPSQPCPVCRRQTWTVPLAELTYTTCVCPVCRNVTTLNAATQAAIEAYTGVGVDGAVEVCSHCQIIVERCAGCRQAQEGQPGG